MSIKLFSALLFPLLLLSVISCSNGFPPEFPAADFTLKSPQTGDTVTYSDLKGRPVIIYWFTSW